MPYIARQQRLRLEQYVACAVGCQHVNTTPRHVEYHFLLVLGERWCDEAPFPETRTRPLFSYPSVVLDRDGV